MLFSDVSSCLNLKHTYSEDAKMNGSEVLFMLNTFNCTLKYKTMQNNSLLCHKLIFTSVWVTIGAADLTKCMSLSFKTVGNMISSLRDV